MQEITLITVRNKKNILFCKTSACLNETAVKNLIVWLKTNKNNKNNK